MRRKRPRLSAVINLNRHDLVRARSAFSNQKANAHKRNIEFHFTFEEWCRWWEDNAGPSWLDRKGTHQGGFVMARFKDEGNYNIGNVKCITTEQNTRYALRKQSMAGLLSGWEKINGMWFRRSPGNLRVDWSKPMPRLISIEFEKKEPPYQLIYIVPANWPEQPWDWNKDLKVPEDTIRWCCHLGIDRGYDDTGYAIVERGAY